MDEDGLRHQNRVYVEHGVAREEKVAVKHNDDCDGKHNVELACGEEDMYRERLLELGSKNEDRGFAKDELQTIQYALEYYKGQLKRDLDTQYNGSETFSLDDEAFLYGQLAKVCYVLLKLSGE